MSGLVETLRGLVEAAGVLTDAVSVLIESMIGQVQAIKAVNVLVRP
jgi:hypothetical protein